MAQKRDYLATYEAACERSVGGTYLHRACLCSSLIVEWSRQRVAGVLDGNDPGATVGLPVPIRLRSPGRVAGSKTANANS